MAQGLTRDLSEQVRSSEFRDGKSEDLDVTLSIGADGKFEVDRDSSTPSDERQFHSARGFAGGPFFPLSRVLSLSSGHKEGIQWKVSADKDWVNLSTTSGYLERGEVDEVIVSINNEETTTILPFDGDTAVLTFTNITHSEVVSGRISFGIESPPTGEYPYP